MKPLEGIKIIECPRDAMQGLGYFIPTTNKIEYLNLLLQVGFDTLDFGSFVSQKIVPQMADTSHVLDGLDLTLSSTKLLAIVANLRGAEEALKHRAITYIGYPFSISETFQKRNTNTDIRTSLALVEELIEKSDKAGKTPIIYLSMSFGNPYGDVWDAELVNFWIHEVIKRGAGIISLSDTIGIATSGSISNLFKSVSSAFPANEFGLHLHSTPETAKTKIEAAYNSGCRRFDAALKGYGGCPMAADKLTGNIATEMLVEYFQNKNEPLNLNVSYLEEALRLSGKIFL